MRFTFKTKLALLVLLAIATISGLLVLSHWLGTRHRTRIDDLERRLVPRIEIALRLDSEFANLTRAFQDAAQAQEPESLGQAARIRDDIEKLIGQAGPALEPSLVLDVQLKLHDYYDAAAQVSTMLIRGQTGESTLQAMEEMQRRQREAELSIAEVTHVDRSELDRTFDALRAASSQANRLRLLTGLCSLLLLLGLGYLTAQRMLLGLATVSRGLSRFATGDFSTPIPVSSYDEFSDLASDANQMADSLRRLAASNSDQNWVRSGQVELVNRIGGDLPVATLTDRMASYLTHRTEALAAAVYLKDAEETLVLSGQFSCSDEHTARTAVTKGQGLLGAALASKEMTLSKDLPLDYFPLVSGLGKSSAPRVLFLPLVRAGVALGVIELAFSSAPPENVLEFLGSIQDTLSIKVDAALRREVVGRLLQETRAQAERLGQQEEELRLSNQELSAQQEELRRANAELEEQQQTLSARNRELDVAREHIEEKVAELSRVSQYKSQFLANMSHELRTPLNSMLLLSHLLSENEARNLTEKQVQHCLTIHSAGKDLLDLINQVLDLSKIEAGRQEIRVEDVSLSHVADVMRRMFEPLATEKHLQFHVRLEEGLPEAFRTDRLRLERVLINLLSNAIKFTEQGEVTLSIGSQTILDEGHFNPQQAPTAMLAFAVRDTGIGIAEGEQERAFIPFEQLEATAARRYQGTGLGLAIVRESVKLLGGDVIVESKAGRGSTFTCLFPLELSDTETRLELPDATRPLEQETSHLDAGAEHEQIHILIIEDDPIFADQLLNIMRGRGLSARLARTGSEGLALAKLARPQGIVLDVKLPDTDGWTVMERLQNDPKTKDIPVHFLSALDAPENGMIRGAVGYLTKPATRHELSELVQTLIPGSQGRSRKILVVEDSSSEGRSIVALLESERFEAVHTQSAEDALAALDREPFGCMILDLGLHPMDGVSLLKILRERPELAQMSIIVHTGRSLTKEEVQELQARAQAIVLKDGSSEKRLIEEVRLFVHYVTQQTTSQGIASNRVSQGESKMLKGLRVLLVEDDMRTVYSLAALLQSRGCEVLVAENGREAIKVLDERADVQCMVTDIMMPEMDGYETIAHVRKQPAWLNLPIVALTARATAGERERCLAAGANAYLSKPVDSDQLIAALSTYAGGTDVG